MILFFTQFFVSVGNWPIIDTAQKMKFSIKDFFKKCGQFCSSLRIWSHSLKKPLMENFIFLYSVRKNLQNANLKTTLLGHMTNVIKSLSLNIEKIVSGISIQLLWYGNFLNEPFLCLNIVIYTTTLTFVD